jgi:hypothetical protein
LRFRGAVFLRQRSGIDFLVDLHIALSSHCHYLVLLVGTAADISGKTAG